MLPAPRIDTYSSAQGVIEGPVEKGLVEIVGPHPVSRIVLSPDEGPAGAGVLVQEDGRGLVDRVYETALQHGPGRRPGARAAFYGFKHLSISPGSAWLT